MARCVILSACPVEPELASLLQPDDFIIACDAGYRNCERLGCRADVVVGDFDSSPQPESVPGQGLCVLPHVKDDTDTEYAAKLAEAYGFQEVLMLGALGGKRMEHTFANICTGLGLERKGVRAALCDVRTRITYVLPGETRVYPRGQYFYLSVFPLEGIARGVEEYGSFYELTNADLSVSYPLGVSNEYAADSQEFRVSTREGALLVVETIAD